MPPEIGVAVYRSVQVAFTNTVKHARATQVAVRLRWISTGLELSITDDGIGGDVSSGGHGLVGIRERAAACGGTAEAGPLVGGGFDVRARLPCLEGAS